MIKRKHKIIGLTTGLFIIVECIGCGNDSVDDTTKAYYRQKFTDSEMEQGHAKFDVAEYLCVDADITPLEKYEDGLNSYYMANYHEEGERDSFLEKGEDITILGQAQDTFFNQLSEFADVEIDVDSMEVSAGDGHVSWIDLNLHGKTNAYDYIFSMNWAYGDSFSDEYVYYPYLDFMIADDVSLTYAYDSSVINSTLQEEGLSFADREELALELIHTLEELTGKELSDTWDCVAVNREMAEEAGLDADALVDEYYSYRFYYEIDGIPVDNIGMIYELKDGENCTLEARYTSEETGSRLNTQSENAQQIVIGENGLLYLFISHLRDAGDIYKGTQEIASPSEILSKLADYYDTQIMTDTVTVTEMRLVYSGYFTDGEDGVIDTAYLPFWEVIVYDESINSYLEYVYDAVTGEAMY